MTTATTNRRRGAATGQNGNPPDKSEVMERYIAEIDSFATMLRDQQELIKSLEHKTAVAKAAFDEARDSLREAKEIEHGTVSLLLKFIRPGSIEIMPLFDTMEPVDEKVQGKDAGEWRSEPVVKLDLSSAALRALIDADIVLVGQLQDRILKGPDWAAELPGISEGIAQAIEAKLQTFIEERGRKRK